MREEGSLGMSVLTVTLNPSIDRTVTLPSLSVGEINRASQITLQPAGKGVNVSRAVHAFGGETHALFIGGKLGESWMSRELDKVGKRDEGFNGERAWNCWFNDHRSD